MTFCDLRGWLLPARPLCFSVLSLPLKAASGPTQAVPQAFPNSVVQELGQRKTGKSGVGGGVKSVWERRHPAVSDQLNLVLSR